MKNLYTNKENISYMICITFTIINITDFKSYENPVFTQLSDHKKAQPKIRQSFNTQGKVKAE